MKCTNCKCVYINNINYDKRNLCQDCAVSYDLDNHSDYDEQIQQEIDSLVNRTGLTPARFLYSE